MGDSRNYSNISPHRLFGHFLLSHFKSLTLSENYLFQVTGKGLEKIANVEFVKSILRVTFCNMIYIVGRLELIRGSLQVLIELFPARLLVFSFLLMYGRTPFFISVGSVFVVSNFVLAYLTLRTKLYKNCFTAFAGWYYMYNVYTLLFCTYIYE